MLLECRINQCLAYIISPLATFQVYSLILLPFPFFSLYEASITDSRHLSNKRVKIYAYAVKIYIDIDILEQFVEKEREKKDTKVCLPCLIFFIGICRKTVTAAASESSWVTSLSHDMANSQHKLANKTLLVKLYGKWRLSRAILSAAEIRQI